MDFTVNKFSCKIKETQPEENSIGLKENSQWLNEPNSQVLLLESLVMGRCYLNNTENQENAQVLRLNLNNKVYTISFPLHLL